MTRMLMVGMPRSGTTWLARVVASTPGLRYVHEPDNKDVDAFAHVAHRGLGSLPCLRPGDRAPDYELMWDVALRGGSPSAMVPAALVRGLRTVGARPAVPKALRIALYRNAARLARLSPSTDPHVLVKTVRAYLSVEWLAEHYRPAVVVVWRHPLNLLSAWLRQGWTSTALAEPTPAVVERFSGTDVWPPPSESGPEGAAWMTCALETILLETADRHPEWALVSHERTSLDPTAAVSRLLAWLGLPVHERIAEKFAAFERPGSGWETHRMAREEPERWRQRLSREEAALACATMDRFSAESAVAARHWREAPVARPAT